MADIRILPLICVCALLNLSHLHINTEIDKKKSCVRLTAIVAKKQNAVLALLQCAVSRHLTTKMSFELSVALEKADAVRYSLVLADRLLKTLMCREKEPMGNKLLTYGAICCYFPPFWVVSQQLQFSFCGLPH